VEPTDPCPLLMDKMPDNIKRCSRGRARGLYEVELLLDGCDILLTLFTGREAYSPWAEIGVLRQCQNTYRAIDELVDLVSGLVEGINRIMVTYAWDAETSSLLDKGIHPSATMIGSILVAKGYYLVKNMYYPEGFAEGNPKIVGERYSDNKWYLEALCEEISSLRATIDRASGREHDTYAEISFMAIQRVIERSGHRC